MPDALKVKPKELTPEKAAKNARNEALLDQYLPVVMEEQKNTRFLDLDRAFSEYKRSHAPVKIKLCKEYFELPRSMPASYFVWLVSISEKNGKRDVTKWSPSEIQALAEAVLPKKAVQLIMEQKVPLEFLASNILPMVIKMWQPEVEEEKNGEQEAKKDGQNSAS